MDKNKNHSESDKKDAEKIKPKTEQESSANNSEKLNDSKHPENKMPPKHVWWLDALYFIVGTLALGGIATLLGWPMFKWDSYPKPMGMAPDWLFSVAWTIIYIAIGVATFCMWRDKELTKKDRKFNLWLYFIHMAFNITWPLFFFRLALPIVACVWLAIIVVLALITTWRYFVANIVSGIIFCVYMMWLIYAFYLNVSICILL
ncbi:MAG: tryptophan-rich sensory protein [Clostridia bacterium]|nr:tryptophan-rich sensory protein [Clostridia bacterium]